MYRVFLEGRRRGRLPCPGHASRQRCRQVSHLTAQGHGAQVLRLQQALQGAGRREPVVQRRQQLPPPLPRLHRRHRLHAGEQGSR
uniref:Uncharacterized protein n=1 Tax=Arundo donax TaxID=35708 RepID=A0A0A9CZB3_ARUDO